MRKKYARLWFVIGLCGSLQIVASLSITEVIVLSSAPFIFMKHSHEMKHDGIMPFFSLSLLVFAGCIIACIANHTHGLFALRGCAVTAIIPCAIIFGHWLIRRDPAGFKWMMVGGAISSVICTFVFQKAVEVNLYAGGSTNAADIMNGTLYWVERLGAFITLPTRGWYLHTPIWIDIPASLFMAIFSVATTTSGRSTALGALAAVALMIIGGKNQRTMKRLSRNFGMIIVLAVTGVFAANLLYRTAATSGWIGEAQRIKYEKQTQGSSSIAKLIMGGRAEAFIGLLACRDKPIIGWGPWAEDRNGYWEEFISRFGTDEDVALLQRIIESQARNGFSSKARLIPGHSHIVNFWLWYGVSGLIFWLYIVFVLVRFIKNDAWVVPQWYAWLATGVPSVFWAIFFSPFASRVGTPIFIVACLMARAVHQRKFVLPLSMIVESERTMRSDGEC